jgi:PAS domain S-box-containing protein
VAFLLTRWQATSRSIRLPERFWLFAIVVFAAISLGFWWTLIKQEQERIEQTIDLKIATRKSDIAVRVQSYILPLVGMVRHWETEETPKLQQWMFEAELNLRNTPAYHAIAWLDPSSLLQWVVLADKAASRDELKNTLEEHRFYTASVLSTRREVTVTRAVKLPAGDVGVLVYVPMIVAGSPAGILVGVLDIRKLLEPLFHQWFPSDGSVALLDREEEIYRLSDINQDQQDATAWGRETSIDLYGLQWRLQVWPSVGLVNAQRSSLPTVTLVGGLSVALLLGLVLKLAQTAQVRALAVEEANLVLKLESSHRQRAESARDVSETRYQALIEGSIQGIVVIRDGMILFANIAAVSMFGYQHPDEVIGKSAWLGVAPHERERLRAYYETHLRGADAPIRCEYQGIKADSALIWLETLASVVSWGGGTAVLATVVDITLRKHVEEALQASEERYRNVFENANDGIATFTLDGILTSINRGGERLLGRPREEVIGRHMSLVGAPTSVALAEERARRFLAGEKLASSTFPIELVRKDGSSVFVEARTRAIRDREGKISGFQGIYRDMTERQLAEEARQRAEVAEAIQQRLEKEVDERRLAEETIRRSENQVRSLLENLLDGILLLDMKGKVRYQSPSMERILGRKAEEVLGKSGFEYVHQDDRSHVLEAFALALKSSGSMPLVELRAWHSDGSWRVLEVLGNNLLDNPLVAGVVLNVRDISERKQIQEELRKSTALAAMGGMAARIAHEINNPLATIKNALLLIKDAIPETHPDLKYLQWSEKEIERIARIVRQMVMLYRPESEGRRLLSLEETLQDVVSLVNVGSKEKEITMTVEESSTPVKIMLPEGSFKQVLFNTMSATTELLPRRSHITVAIAADHTTVRIAIRNQWQSASPLSGVQDAKAQVLPAPGAMLEELTTKLSVVKILLEAIGGSLHFPNGMDHETLYTIVLPSSEAQA